MAPRAPAPALPEPAAPPNTPAPPPTPPAPERPASAPLPESARSASTQGGWLEASQADAAPVPVDNEWLLANTPWPAAYPRLILQLWISSKGVIERVEVQGEAADDPTVQALLEPLIDTPMRPARIGRVPVPSTMRIELWQGDGGAPNFVGPLAPGVTAGGGARP